MTHKKLATIIHCYTEIEKLIHQDISLDDAKKLIAVNDALKKIKELVEQTLTGSAEDKRKQS